MIVDGHGVPKIVDFGLAQLIAPRAGGEPPPITRADDLQRFEGDGSPTTRSTLVGTPRYLAPELWRGQPASVQSDVYALGALMYRLCAGKTPFAHVAIDDLREVTSACNPPALLDAVPDMDARFSTIVDQCLMRDPGQRFASADELEHALSQRARDVRCVPPPPVEPYRGLAVFDSEHQPFFFGRDRETVRLLERHTRAEATT